MAPCRVSHDPLWETLPNRKGKIHLRKQVFYNKYLLNHAHIRFVIALNNLNGFQKLRHKHDFRNTELWIHIPKSITQVSGSRYQYLESSVTGNQIIAENTI